MCPREWYLHSSNTQLNNKKWRLAKLKTHDEPSVQDKSDSILMKQVSETGYLFGSYMKKCYVETSCDVSFNWPVYISEAYKQRQGIKGEMTCTVDVALVWNITYWIMMLIIIIMIIMMMMMMMMMILFTE